MKNTIFYLFMLISFFTMTSCFDLVEEIDLTNSGTGKFKITLNLSKSKTKVASIMQLGKIDGYKLPSEREIQNEMKSITNILKSTNGISNVKSNIDFTNYIATLSCDFNDINTLNIVIKSISSKFKTELSSYSTYAYNNKTKTLTRSYTYNPEAKKALNKLNSENKNNFQDAFYTSIYRFNGTIAKQQNNQAKIANSKKAVMLKANAIDILSGKIDLSNTIQLN